MAIDAFVSYAHADEAALDRLRKHLAMLRRDQILNAWTDHQILAGARFDEADDYSIYLTMDMFSRGQKVQRYTARQAAEALWLDLTGQAGVEYE